METEATQAISIENGPSSEVVENDDTVYRICVRVSEDTTNLLTDIERAVIERTLQDTNGNKPEAARILGISLKTLYNRLNWYAARDTAAKSAETAPDIPHSVRKAA